MIADEDAARRFCAERCGPEGMQKLDRLAASLAEENARQNLASGGSLASVWQRHFADSLQLLDHAADAEGLWLDLGSGAGFPGLPLAIARPNARLTLVESRRRRIEWLERCISDLNLSNCSVIGARVENAAGMDARVITARAFAPFAKLLRLSARFSTPATVWLLPKGRSAAQELAAQPARVAAMFHVEQSVTDPGGGILIGRGVPLT